MADISINRLRKEEFLTEYVVDIHVDPTLLRMTGYHDDYSASAVVDRNSSSCQEITTQQSKKSFRLEVELPTVHDHLKLTAVLADGHCSDFPAMMVYTERDRSAMLPYHNNPSFCDKVPGECVFTCDCSVIQCHTVSLVIMSHRQQTLELCEISLSLSL